ncbi:unnamed protein product [Rotaria sp. Silwood2]|nr:unnamed protein product [Rotaria sp. Silwood2]
MSSLPTITPTPPLSVPVTNSFSLTIADINSYRKNGYHIIPNLLSPSQLEQWRTIVFSAVNDRAERNGKLIGKIAAELEGIDLVRIWHNQALIKESFANPTAWHLDVPYWSFTSLHAISVWIALDDATLENGCLYFMPGSHKVTERRYYAANNAFMEIKVGKNLSDVFITYPELKQWQTVAVPMKAGNASFHSDHLIHSAGANMTPGRRAAMTIQMMPDNMTFNENHIKNFRPLSVGTSLHIRSSSVRSHELKTT